MTDRHGSTDTGRQVDSETDVCACACVCVCACSSVVRLAGRTVSGGDDTEYGPSVTFSLMLIHSVVWLSDSFAHSKCTLIYLTVHNVLYYITITSVHTIV